MLIDLAFILATLAALTCGYHLHRVTRERDQARADLRDARSDAVTASADAAEREAEAREAVACFERLAKVHADQTADLEWARLILATMSAEADMYRTAFTAVMLNQVRAELIEPDDPAGVADVYELPLRPKAGAS